VRDLIFGFLSLFVAWRGIVGFVSCVGLSLILLSLAPSQKMRFFETATSSVLFPVQFVISSIASHRDLRDENERLKLENAQLRARVDKLFQMGLENRRIREMLKMDSIAEYPNVVGTILARDLGFEGSSCLMDVGEEDRVAMDMPVYTMRGLVGRVSRVARDHSEIQLLNSTSSRVGVMNNRSRVQSVLEPGVGGDLQMGSVMKWLPRV
jgi:rod shape-determining protein MreC